MNKAVLLVLLHISINLSIGFSLVIFPQFTELGVTSGFTYDTTVTGGVNESMGETINPGGEVEDKGDAIYRVLDLINLGFISRFLNMIDQYMFGLYNLLYNMLGGLMDSVTRTFIFGALKGIIIVIYVLTALYWWTSKNPTES